MLFVFGGDGFLVNRVSFDLNGSFFWWFIIVLG